MLCAIWYHLYNFKNVKNTHGRMSLYNKSNTPPSHFYIVEMVPIRAKHHIWVIDPMFRQPTEDKTLLSNF